MNVLLTLLKSFDEQVDVRVDPADNGVTCIADVQASNVVKQLVEDIETELDKNLITNDGKINSDGVSRLESEGYRHRVFEQDSFGPLICGVKTKHGWITYG